MNEIRHYIDPNDRDLFDEWVAQLRDLKAKKAVDRRIVSLRTGNFGDCKPLHDGVWELRIDIGPGYRIYYAKVGQRILLLLCGGDKRKQQSDIDKACKYWKEWQNRSGQEEKS